MSAAIQDLWPDVRVDVLTPLAILRSQVTPLEQKTKGIVRAEVISAHSESDVEHRMDLIAPALDYYRVTIVRVKHPFDRVYPAGLEAVSVGTTSVPSDEAFIQLLSSVFRSIQVNSILQDLIARSNEMRELTAPPSS